MPNESEKKEEEVEKVEEEVEEESEAEEEAAEEEEETEETTHSPSTEEEEEKIDYEAIAKAEKERADKAESKLAGKAFKKREKKRDEPEEEPEEEEDESRPMTVGEYNQRREQDRQSDLKASRTKDAKAFIEANISNLDEREAIFQFWRGRVTPSDSLQDDIEIAIAGVNRKSLLGKNKEMARALKGKKGAHKTAPGGVQKDGVPGPGPKMATSDKASMKRAGYVYDTQAKHYVKTLKNGNTLIKKNIKSQPQLMKKTAN